MKLGAFIRATLVWFAVAIVAACQTSDEVTAINQSGNTVHQLLKVGADTISCEGVAPMTCLIVNGEIFYDYIEGYTHQEGVARTLRVERTQICDPKVLNSCPQDASIYRYRLLEIVE